MCDEEERPDSPESLHSVHGRHTLEFSRLANITDAVFAIAMTLLVFDISVPDPLPGTLGEVVLIWPDLLAFMISFAVLANCWWMNHSFVASLRRIEPGLIGLTLLILGLVALLPFATALLSAQGPVSHAVVAPYIALVGTIALVHTCMVVRAWRAGAMGSQITADVFRLELIISAGWVCVMLIAIGIAFFAPPWGLVALLLGPLWEWGVERVASRKAAV